ncbi:MAG: SDR family oxidoreductase [Nostoc sp. ChiSLP02]|nr:SDR family oxidoreductase [Nostoc sp. DedSLP05]MDZ8103258.1 SDR family oxidoreductase [Nostoc sp. DedSLP01]MDZ8187705.1 SDR family oxidoreductase [Nostoc sp. ChiSLP02]
MSKKQILITGGDGYIGSRIARKYLQVTQEPILLWVRANDEHEFQNKVEKLNLYLDNYSERVSYSWGDLRQAQPFNLIDPGEIKLIVHSASVTRFNVDRETARQVNIEGTEKLLNFANTCHSLEGFGLLSTVYASGIKSGLIAEIALDDRDGFANYYEWSKWESENLLINQFSHLPWSIFRVATVIADNIQGYVTQQNAFHNTLKLLYYGLLSLIPGKPETPLYFVTGDFVTDAIFKLMSRSCNQEIYHIAHTKAESPCLGDIIDIAFTTFTQTPEFKVRRVLKPLYADPESFNFLVDAVKGFGGNIVNEAVSSVSPFSKQLFIDKEINNQKLVSAFDNYQAENPQTLIENTCQYLLKQKWAKQV